MGRSCYTTTVQSYKTTKNIIKKTENTQILLKPEESVFEVTVYRLKTIKVCLII